MRYLGAAVLAAIAGVFGLVAYGSLHWLWSDHPDNSTEAYLAFGLPALIMAVAAFVGAVWVLRKP